MKSARKIIIFVLLLSLCLAFAVPASAEAVPDVPDGAVYIYDSAKVISEGDKAAIIKKGSALFAMTGAQVVVAAVNNTSDMTVSEFGDAMFNTWKIGSKERNNGVLILMIIEDNTYWLLQSKGLDTILTDGAIHDLRDGFLEPEFAKGNYSAAALSSHGAFCDLLADRYGVDLASWDGVTYSFTPRSEAPDTAVIKTVIYIALGVGAVVAVAAIIIMIRKRMQKKVYRKRHTAPAPEPSYRPYKPANAQSRTPTRRPPSGQAPRAGQARGQSSRGQAPNGQSPARRPSGGQAPRPRPIDPQSGRGQTPPRAPRTVVNQPRPQGRPTQPPRRTPVSQPRPQDGRPRQVDPTRDGRRNNY